MENRKLYQMPLLGYFAPSFKEITTQGKIVFSKNYSGSYNRP